MLNDQCILETGAQYGEPLSMFLDEKFGRRSIDLNDIVQTALTQFCSWENPDKYDQVLLHLQRLAVDIAKDKGYRDAILAEIYETEKASILRYILKSYQLSYDDAEDIVQTAFLRLYECGLEKVDNPGAFIKTVARNLVLDQIRHMGVKLRYRSEVETDLQREECILGPEKVAEDQQRLSMLDRVLSLIPGKRRDMLLLNRIDGVSYAEISRRSGCAESTVRKNISAALCECHEALEHQ